MEHSVSSMGEQKPKCLGTGLVALDVVIGADPRTTPALWAGGSCGNVLTILAYLGWETYPIARLGNDAAADELVKDMERWGVNTSLMSRDPKGSTPIIVERIKTNASGRPFHRFEWVCPNCGSWLPRYRPVLARDVDAIVEKMPPARAFYFDRAVRSSVALAQEQKQQGALIVFEPSSMKDERMFRECLDIADIVKYSCERFGDDLDLPDTTHIPLEIRTLGDIGLRYRTNGGQWNQISAYSVPDLRDAAGSGDWCTAGLISVLGRGGSQGLDSVDEGSITDALKFGQALAAINCQFEGARGGMYSLTMHEFSKMAYGILDKEHVPSTDNWADSQLAASAFQCICPECITRRVNTGGSCKR